MVQMQKHKQEHHVNWKYYLDYAAPEIWKGELYNWSCDIWSIGCIIYEMAATFPPFRASDLISLSKKI